jgi:hypothetical protein
MVGHTERYLITFKVGPKHLREASFGIIRSSAVAFDLMSSTVVKCNTLRPIFRVGNSQKSPEARPGDCGGWVMTQQAMCGSVRYPDAETTVPACYLPRRAASSELHRATSCTRK